VILFPGLICSDFAYIIFMNASFLTVLRCPIDPVRETPLEREDQNLVCLQCQVRFPLKQGTPILMLRDAELPANCAAAGQLPCVRKGRARRRARPSP